MRNALLSGRSIIRALALGSAVAIIAAGCSSSASAGWTFAPEPSATPAPSGSAAASAGASGAAPSGSAAASASAGASSSAGAPAGSGGTGTATTLKIAALNIAFDTAQLQAPAGQPIAIDFDNQDSGIPHNIQIKDASGASVFKGDIVTGPTKTTYQVPALKAGTYQFVCDVHPTMTGTLTVQ